MGRAIDARPWRPQDLIDDLQALIDEEQDKYLNDRHTTLCMARDYLKAYFSLPQLSNEWVSVENAVPEPGERVLASDGIFVGEAYRTSANSWYRHTGFPWRDGVTGRTVRYWMYMPNP